MKKALLIIGSIAVILLPAGYMTYKILSTAGVECEVCIEFRGRSQCRSASGPDEMSCRQTATDNACAFLASGMTDSMACDRTEPQSVTFKKPN